MYDCEHELELLVHTLDVTVYLATSGKQKESCEHAFWQMHQHATESNCCWCTHFILQSVWRLLRSNKSVLL